MMKKIFSIICATFSIIMLVFITSCDNKEKSAKGYGLVHKNYIGIADIKTKRNRVRYLSFEEVFLPDHWAEITDKEIDEDLVVKYINSRKKEVAVAKYIVIGNKKFTAKLSYDAKEVIYSSNDIKDLKAYLIQKEENAKWYAEELLAKNAYVADSNFNKLSTSFVGQSGFNKTEAGYWPNTNGGLGWKSNMEALSDAFVGTKMNLNEAKCIIDESSKTWKFDKIQSSATLVDAMDYYIVAKRAYSNAISQ